MMHNTCLAFMSTKRRSVMQLTKTYVDVFYRETALYAFSWQTRAKAINKRENAYYMTLFHMTYYGCIKYEY